MWKPGLLTLYLFVLSIYDLKRKHIPICWLVIGGAVAFIIVCIYGGEGVVAWKQLFCGALPGISFLLVAGFTGKMGYADGIVLVIMGVCLGYVETAVLLCISLFVLSFFCISFLFLKKIKGHMRIPYMPFLLAAFVLQQALSLHNI